MANFIYNSAKVSFGKAEIAWQTDTIKIALVTSSYTPDKDTHQYFSDVTNELTGGGYTTGGYTLANCTVTPDNTNDRAVFDADDVSISGITNTFRYGVIYKSTGVAGTSRLIALIDLEGADVSLTNGQYTITWNTNGVFYLGES